MRHPPRPPATSQRGVGALVVVMVLFFIMSMVAAYASRNLIFEQKTSANNYRAMQAFEAAEAGLEWAIAMLNGGRIDALCGGTNDVTKDTFRDRYLSVDVNEVVDVRKWGANEDLLPTCVRGADGWNCSCPNDSAPVVAAPVGTDSAPAFQIRFSKQSLIAGKPIVGVRSQGCSTIGDRCFGFNRQSDALAEVNALVGLAASLTQVPVAALTVRGTLTAPAARIVNETGVVINAGGGITAPNASGPAGSPPMLRNGDGTLSNMVPAGGMTLGEMMFLATFGMHPKTYRTQPAVVRLTCGIGIDCTTAVQDAAAEFPLRVIWIDGDLNINGALTLGSIASPVILVVDGNITIGDAGSVTINGMVYSRGATWNNGGGAALVRGAFVAEGDAANNGNFSISGAPTVVFDHDVVERLKKVQARRGLDFGSMARVPGSWKDF